MRTLFINLLILFTSIITICQEYEAFDGTVYKVGDSVLIGFNTGYNYYDNISELHVDQYGSSYQDVKKDISFKKYKIKSVGKDANLADKLYEDENTIFLTIGTRGYFKEEYYVILEDAIRSGEIVSRIIPENQRTNYKRFSDTLSLLYYIKTTIIPVDKFKEEYLYRYINDLYTKTKEDEFEYHNALQTSKKEIEKKIQLLDFNTSYSISTTLNLDNYDFEYNGFKITNETLSFKLVKAKTSTWGAPNDYPAISIVFPNYDKFRFISVYPQYANSFVKRRKDKYGNVDREVYARINFKILNVDDSERHANDRYSDNLLTGKIESIELYEFNNYLYNWIGTIK